MIVSQTKIFKNFSGSLQTTSVAKILPSYCNRYTYKYISHRNLRINRLYFEISNSTEKKKECLTIERCDVNHLEPSKCRTGAENNHQQICYFNRNKKDKSFNRFLENVYHKIDNELKEFNNDIA